MAGITLGSLLLSALVATSGPEEMRLYGRVTTHDGSVMEGWLRWDRNEASRADFLDGSRELSEEALEVAERLDPEFAEEMRQRRSIVAFGMRIRWDEDDLEGRPDAATAVRFAHVAVLEPLEGRRVRLTLVGGEQIELIGTTTDVGPGMRDLLIEVGSDRPVDVDWHEIERVDFLDPPDDVPAPSDLPLHGTVETWSGLELTGWIAWDRDEVLGSDVLDGYEDGTEYAIPFAEIVAIAPEGRRSARVSLRSGEERILRGTNDVDRGNRGIEVSDPALGRAVVGWEDLQEVRFHPPTTDAAPSWFPPGPIRGTVYARDGRVLEGAIRWGHEEERSWELLDGWVGDTEVSIEFGAIEQIRRAGPDEVVVSTVDGRIVRLEDSDDVGEGHRGLFIAPDAGSPTRLVRWDDVDRVLLRR